MSNVMPEFTIDSMTDGLMIRINSDFSIDAKIALASGVVSVPGSFRINTPTSSTLITVSSQTFVRVYPV